jgi:error-prone DNA polymerase
VGSLVCYLVGLSHIDPIRNQLFLGRFLNEEMHSLPDIDLDFPRDIREKLIQRVHERWGPERAALVATIPRYRIRSAIRDLGKALGLPEVELDRLAKLSEGYGSSRAPLRLPLGQGLDRRRPHGQDRFPGAGHALAGRGVPRPDRRAPG